MPRPRRGVRTRKPPRANKSKANTAGPWDFQPSFPGRNGDKRSTTFPCWPPVSAD